VRYLDGSPLELMLRRAALAMHASPLVLRALGRLVPGSARERWLLFVSNYAHWSAARERLSEDEWDRVTRGVPVLLYHAFGDDESRYVVSRTAFARQLRLLAVLRFRVRPYAEVARALREGRLPPPRTVALTFDDGYADNATIAVPLLERHGFSGTIFLVSSRLGRVNDWSAEPPLAGRALLSAEEIAALRSRGIEFGAHTRTHPDLTADDVSVMDEIEASRIELEGVPTFAYPYGRVNDRAVAAVRESGFQSACTTDPRLAQVADDPLLVPRIEIKREDSLAQFVRKLWFGGA
jgi:polysaccharide deacetylase